MNARPMFLRQGPERILLDRRHTDRNFLDRPRETVPMVYGPASTELRSGRFIDDGADEPRGCSVCRDSDLHCPTPDSCFLPDEITTAAPRPWFCDSPAANVAITVALLVAVGVVAWLLSSGAR